MFIDLLANFSAPAKTAEECGQSRTSEDGPRLRWASIAAGRPLSLIYGPSFIASHQSWHFCVYPGVRPAIVIQSLPSMSSSCVLRRPSRCAHPDILTNNFIDALFLAVCVWFLIVAQLRWTHVIIAHFMTHLSNARPWSRPWHWHRHRHSECPLFGGDFLHHAASDSWTSVLLLFLFYLPLQSSADETVTRHLFGRDISTPDCHFAFAGIRNGFGKTVRTLRFKYIQFCIQQMVLWAIKINKLWN